MSFNVALSQPLPQWLPRAGSDAGYDSLQRSGKRGSAPPLNLDVERQRRATERIAHRKHLREEA